MELLQKIHFNDAINEQIIEMIAYIDGFEIAVDDVEKLEKEHLIQLKNVATVESIGSSTRIEGATMTDVEIGSLIDNMKITSLETRDEQEVVGYYDALDLVQENYVDMPLTENIVKQLHGVLLKHSHKDQNHKGGYKSLSNSVVANYPDGRQKVIFNTTAPHLTANEMFDLVHWTEHAFETNLRHPIVIIAIFIYEFLSIHPFQDGNGRLSRILTTLLLLRSKYRFIQYISFENHIELHKEVYYAALMNGQKNRNTDNESMQEWMMFFLKSLRTLADKLQLKLDNFKPKVVYLSERHKKMIAFVAKNKAVKMTDISKHFDKIKESSLKKDVRYLVINNCISKIGELKATVYVMP